MFNLNFAVQQISNTSRVLMLTLLTDLLPGVWRVHEGCVLYLVVDVFVLVEGEGAAERDVRDHADGPHVQRAVVALVAEHLWGCGGERWGG